MLTQSHTRNQYTDSCRFMNFHLVSVFKQSRDIVADEYIVPGY